MLISMRENENCYDYKGGKWEEMQIYERNQRTHGIKEKYRKH